MSLAPQEGRKSQRPRKTEEYVAWEGEITLDIATAKAMDGVYTTNYTVPKTKPTPDTRESKQRT